MDIRIHLATLVRHALAEVCTVPVLLVFMMHSLILVMPGKFNLHRLGTKDSIAYHSIIYAFLLP